MAAAEYSMHNVIKRCRTATLLTGQLSGENVAMRQVQNDKYYENVRKNTGSSRWMNQDLLADSALGAIDVVTDVC